MKQYLIPHTGSYYKANLHSHSTVSDGKFTPEEVKEAYKAKGYSVYAYTDHQVMLPHFDLADEDFLPLTGYEIDITEQGKPWPNTKTCHICLIALDPDNTTQPLLNLARVSDPRYVVSKTLIKTDETLAYYEHDYTPEAINRVMQIAREKGFFVTYNHPVWSMEGYTEYSAYKYMNAFEICNYGCVAEGYDEHNGQIYDELLRQGQRLYCVATDDNHSESHQFGGFTMIKAEKLDYKTITDALVAGNFYASEGPTIHDLWIEDGKVHITCDPAKEIFITNGVRRSRNVRNADGLVTEAEFDVSKEDIYFRLTVIGEDGTKAYTNAYFTDEIEL